MSTSQMHPRCVVYLAPSMLSFLESLSLTQAWTQLEVTVNKCVRPEKEMSTNQGGVYYSGALPHMVVMLDAPYRVAALTAATLGLPLVLRGLVALSQKHTAGRERVQDPVGGLKFPLS